MILPFLKPPAIVILYLQNPRERFWGAVRALDATGVLVDGVDLESFDSWVGQIAGGEEAGATTVFFPMLRVEKVLVDARSGAAPSLADQFARRTGRSAIEYLGSG
jgi:hypothetical protein